MFSWMKGKSKSKEKDGRARAVSSVGVEEKNPLGTQHSTNLFDGNSYAANNVGMPDYESASFVNDILESNPGFKKVTQDLFKEYGQEIGSGSRQRNKQEDDDYSGGVKKGYIDFDNVDEDEEEVSYQSEEEVQDTSSIDVSDSSETDPSDEEWKDKMQEFHDMYLSVCQWKNWQVPVPRRGNVQVEVLRGVERGTSQNIGSSTIDKLIVPCEPPYEEPEELEDDKFDSFGDGALCVGATFKTRRQLRRKIVEYLMGKRNTFKSYKTAKKRYWVQCRLKNECPFTVRATGLDSGWTVYKITDHTCQFNPSVGATGTLPSRELGDIMAEKIVTPGQVMVPRALQKELKINHGITVNYAQARRIQKRALEAVYGSEDESFKELPSYLFVLQQKNPGTMCDFLVDETTGKFRYAFFALGASIGGFARARPFIAIDGTHLKSKYRGILFVAVTKDPNNQIFPLAFGVGGVESRESWSWFLQRVRYSLNCSDGMLVVSDGSKAISGAVADVFPDGHHVLCCYHIQQNLVPYGKRVVELFRRAAWSYNDADYERAMADLEHHCPAAARHLLGVVGEHKFARVKCPVRRYDIMTTNIVESMNNRLNWARRLPICSLLEAARSIVEQWFAYRHGKALESLGPLTPYALKKLGDALEAGAKMLVTPHSESDVLVKHGERVYRVRIGTRQCECNIYQHELIPCPHAAAAIRYLNHHPIAYVDEFFKIENLRAMWSGAVMHLPNKCNWVVPRGIGGAICRPPDNPRQAGRPRMRRHPSGAEGSSRQRKIQQCSRCGGTGHNAKRCTVEIPGGQAVPPTENVSRVRARKKCSICGLQGHTAPTCPVQRQFDMNHPAAD